MKKSILTRARLVEVVVYNPETGEFTNRIQRNSRALAGKVTGHKNAAGYTNIWVDRQCYLAHRLAFLYMLGRWPKHQVDHKNRIPGDTRWENLREADYSQNNANKPTRSKYGLKGVCRSGSKWSAQFKCRGTRRVVYGFNSPEEAHLAYMEMAVAAHGEFVAA